MGAIAFQALIYLSVGTVLALAHHYYEPKENPTTFILLLLVWPGMLVLGIAILWFFILTTLAWAVGVLLKEAWDRTRA